MRTDSGSTLDQRFIEVEGPSEHRTRHLVRLISAVRAVEGRQSNVSEDVRTNWGARGRTPIRPSSYFVRIWLGGLLPGCAAIHSGRQGRSTKCARRNLRRMTSENL
jgi:hypothetical protein